MRIISKVSAGLSGHDDGNGHSQKEISLEVWTNMEKTQWLLWDKMNTSTNNYTRWH